MLRWAPLARVARRGLYTDVRSRQPWPCEHFIFIDREVGLTLLRPQGSPVREGAAPLTEAERLAFWRSLRHSNLEDKAIYPYVSVLGGVAHRVIVDWSLRRTQAATLPIVFTGADEESLTYDEGRMSVPFHPEFMAICLERKLLLHPAMGTRLAGLGILHTCLESRFLEHIRAGGERSGILFEHSSELLEVERVFPEELPLLPTDP